MAGGGIRTTSDFRRCRFSRPRSRVSSVIVSIENGALYKGFPAQTYHPVSLRIGLDSVRSINTLLTLDPFQLPKGLERRSPAHLRVANY